MANSRDRALIERCKRGDRRALGELVSTYERPVFNAAYRIVGSREDAADITQAVFLKTFERLDQYNPEYKFFSWIYRITINESINHRQRTRKEIDIDGIEIETEFRPEDTVDDNAVSAAIQAGLMGLQPDYRVVLVLRHFSELSYKEISEVLQVPEKTVKSRLFSARQLMRERLGEMGVFEHGG